MYSPNLYSVLYEYRNIIGLKLYRVTISLTFKSATNSCNFEYVLIFFVHFEDLGHISKITSISCTFKCMTNSCAVNVQTQ